MPFRLRRSLKVGPLRINITEKGFSSITVKAGRVSWNSRTRATTVDTPGPGSWRSKGRTKR